jgi:choline dehydrogenase-like flavoprotein
MPSVGEFDDVCEQFEGYGAALKKKCRDSYGTTIGFAGRGEMIPNPDCYCEIDPNQVDEWGIPVLRFHWKWGENELAMAEDMQNTFRQIVEAAGGTYLESRLPESHISSGGEIIHELGVARMGSDPRKSALNGYCQAHEVKNLFVTDGACFVSNADKNPTLTIMALCWRASEYLLSEAKKGNI